MWEMYGPFGEHYWDREYKEKQRIISDNYNKIVEHYELQTILYKLAEVEPKYKVHFRDCHNWEVNCNNGGFRFYRHSRELDAIISLGCKLNLYKLLDNNRLTLVDVLKVHFTSELRNLLVDMPFRIIIRDIASAAEPDFHSLGLNIYFRVILSIGDEYSITIENLEILEGIFPLVKRMMNKTMDDLYREIRKAEMEGKQYGNW